MPATAIVMLRPPLEPDPERPQDPDETIHAIVCGTSVESPHNALLRRVLEECYNGDLLRFATDLGNAIELSCVVIEPGCSCYMSIVQESNRWAEQQLNAFRDLRTH